MTGKRIWKKAVAGALLAGVLLQTAVGGGRAEAADGTWKHDKNGWWYAYSGGGYATDVWMKENGSWYHFDSEGYMQTGWQNLGGKWYFFRKSGAMHTGWKKYNGKWYYFTANGAMHTGWKLIDGTWYFFAGSGVMYTGWKKAGGNWYYLDPDGAMVTGQVTIDGEQCIFDTDGVYIGKKVSELRSIEEAEIGDRVRFGTYEQDKDSSNGAEPIEWIVLAEEEGRKLLISKWILDCQVYHTSNEDVTWENSSIRTWLNDTFLNTAFDSDEKARIPKTTIIAEDNQRYATDAGKNTKDQVFLLSISEADAYFAEESNGTSRTRGCTATLSAEKKGVWMNTSNESDWYYGNGWWWLRTPGYEPDCATFVNYNGSIVDGGSRVNRGIVGVRPAIWVNVED